MPRILIAVVLLVFALLWAHNAWSMEIDANKLADAIYIAEGGAIYKPYGVLKAYCKRGDPDGQCRKGCIQTINKWKNKLAYTSDTEFIFKFAEIYAPTKGLELRRAELLKNPNWARNVLYWYTHPKK